MRVTTYKINKVWFDCEYSLGMHPLLQFMVATSNCKMITKMIYTVRCKVIPLVRVLKEFLWKEMVCIDKYFMRQDQREENCLGLLSL